MSVTLNHTIVWCRDKKSSARYLTEILGLRVFGHGDPSVITPENSEWNQLQWDGDHVVLYSGLHSHATYVTKGQQTQSLNSLADQLLPASLYFRSVHT